MLMSTASWLTVPITLTKSFGNKISRRGNTHEFFAPVSVYETKDGYVYIAVGNDRQWVSFTQLPGFEKLAGPAYEKNKGRVNDVKNLNLLITDCTRTKSTDEIIDLCQKATIAISRVNTIEEVIEDVLYKRGPPYRKRPDHGYADIHGSAAVYDLLPQGVRSSDDLSAPVRGTQRAYLRRTRVLFRKAAGTEGERSYLATPNLAFE